MEFIETICKFFGNRIFEKRLLGKDELSEFSVSILDEVFGKRKKNTGEITFARIVDWFDPNDDDKVQQLCNYVNNNFCCVVDEFDLGFLYYAVDVGIVIHNKSNNLFPSLCIRCKKCKVKERLRILLKKSKKLYISA
jgi:hypothetical protein